jgi:ABC-2 type transport system permease protein
VTLLAEMALTALALTAFGVMLAARISQVESFQMVTQFFVLPMFFLSGAIFPISKLPAWLGILSKLDPLSYAIDPFRKAVFSQVQLPAVLQRTLDPGISWGSWQLPVWFELGMVAVAAAVMLGVAIRQFAKTD